MIEIPKIPKRVILEVYDNQKDDSPQVLEFCGDSCTSTRYQTSGSELLEDYAKVLQFEEKDEDGNPVLVIRAYRRW